VSSAPTGTHPGQATAARPRAGMTLWRLELLRLLRTHRWMILFGVYLVFGVIGALSARYLNEMLERMGGEMTIVAPDPRPVDGLIQFVSNASQLGLLAVVVVAAAALAFDAHPERAAFLRTRMERPGRLVLAPYAITTVATVLAMVVGTVVTVALTTTLIGALPLAEVAIGTAYGALYLAFVVAVVAVMASLVRSQVGVVFAALGALILLPMVAMIDVIKPWVPSELLTAVIALVEGEAPTAYLRAAGVTVVVTVGLLVLTMRRLERREL
jgi:ABC-2 type transport system permease protein